MLWTGTLIVSLAIAVGFVLFSAPDGGEGQLTVRSVPDVATQIVVGGEARNTSEIRGLPLPVGPHEVCFEGPEDHLRPSCETAVVADGEETTLVVRFEEAGHLDVVIEPTSLRPDVTVDGILRDRGPIRVPLGAGDHDVCVAEIAGYDPLGCQTVTISVGETTEMAFTYVESDAG